MKAIRFVLALFAVSLFATQASASEAAVKSYTQTLVDDVLAVITSDATEGAKLDKLDAIFLRNVDTDWIGKFVLGKYWRTASEEQKQAYLKNYAGFLSKTYTRRFTEYSNEKVEISGVKTVDNSEYEVRLELAQPDAQPVFMTFKVRGGSKASMRVFDIIVEGVSLITTQRSEFSSVVERKGLDYLIDVLKKKASA